MAGIPISVEYQSKVEVLPYGNIRAAGKFAYNQLLKECVFVQINNIQLIKSIGYAFTFCEANMDKDHCLSINISLTKLCSFNF